MFGVPFLPVGGGSSRARVQNSLRFRANNSAFLSRTPGAPASRTTWTASFWIKRGLIGSGHRAVFGAMPTNGSAPYDYVSFGGIAADALDFYFNNAAGVLQTTAVFRDPSAFYPVQIVADTTQAQTSANAPDSRMRIFVNGAQITSFAAATMPAQNSQSAAWNVSGTQNNIGVFNNGINAFGDMLLANFYFIDGQALAPSSFGEIDPATGQWVPKRYSGAYGANGFFLPFDNATSTATIGQDRSGNGNDWASSGISVTAGPTFDQLTDTPTNNFCTLNPLFNPGAGSPTYSEGNLFVNFPGAGVGGAVGSIAMESGDFYWEVECLVGSGANNFCPGVALTTAMPGGGSGWTDSTGFWGYISSTGNKINGGSASAYGATFTTGDIIGVRFNRAAGELSFSKNGVAQGVAYTGLTSGAYVPAFNDGTVVSSKSYRVNFGQRPFIYSPLGGALALNTRNLPTPTILRGDDAYLETIYAGNSGTQAISNRFSAGSIRQKAITVARSWSATNSVRGFNLVTRTDTTDIEIAGSSISSVSPTAINLQNADNYNTTGENYILQAWRIGAAYGFNVVVYTGNGGTQNVSHGLNAVPHYIEVKKISGAAQRWCLFHRGFGAARYGYLNENFAFDTANAINRWGNNTVTVEPTSSVFTVGNSDDVNSSGNLYVAFVYTSIPGLSAFPSYIGNSSTVGPWTDLGFKFRTLTIKDGSAASAHRQFSGTRQPFNGALQPVYPNGASLPQAENFIERYASGFRPITGAGNGVNDNGNHYLVTAFAEAPFKYATAV
jgi:hypothetical protein